MAEDSHVDSCSRHGSIVFEWSKEDKTLVSAASPSAASSPPGGQSPQFGNDGGGSESSSQKHGAASPGGVGGGGGGGNNKSSLASSSNASTGTGSVNGLPTPAAVVPYRLVGLLLFHPHISIDDETTEANILFSERRGGPAWGGGATPIPHAVPNHAGLCSGIRMLASIFCASSSDFKKQETALKDSMTAFGPPLPAASSSAKSSPSLSPRFESLAGGDAAVRQSQLRHFGAQAAAQLPGVRYVTQVRGVHVFFEPEPEFVLVVTLERAPHLSRNDGAIVDEVAGWCAVYCDALRVLHSPLTKLLGDALEQQRAAVQAAVDEQHQRQMQLLQQQQQQSSSKSGGKVSNNSFKAVSKKKVESQARVSAAREMCVKVGPLFHSMYDYLEDCVRTHFGGPLFLAHIQQQINNRAATSSGNATAKPPGFTPTVSGVSSSTSTGTPGGGSAPDFGEAASQQSANAAANSSGNSGAGSGNQPPTPLFGPLQLAPAPPELRMCAAVLCSRVLDAHLSLLRHAIIVEAATVLAPQSMCTQSPVVLASSLPPFATAAVLGAAGLYRPPPPPPPSPSSSSSSSPKDKQQQQPIDVQLLSVRSGGIRFLRSIRLKGDGSQEIPSWSGSRGVRGAGGIAVSSSGGGGSSGVRAVVAPSVEAAVKKSTVDYRKLQQMESEKNKSGDALRTADDRDDQQDGGELIDTSQYEKSELWLLQLGPHLLLCCEVKSSLLSVAGTRMSLAQGLVTFLHARSTEVLVLADLLHAGTASSSLSSSVTSASAASPTASGSPGGGGGGGGRVPAAVGAAHFATAAAAQLLLTGKSGAASSSSSSSSSSSHVGGYDRVQQLLSFTRMSAGVGAGGADESVAAWVRMHESQRNSQSGAQLNEFPHFLENAALHIGTVNTHARWFPPASAGNSRQAAADAAADGAAAGAESSGGGRRGSAPRGGGGGGASAAAAAATAAAAGAAGLGALGIARPTEDDVQLGPPQFILRGMLLSSPEHAALREEGIVVGQRNLKLCCALQQRQQQARGSSAAADSSTERLLASYQDDVERWFTRGSSTYGSAALALVSDRLQGNAAVETTRVSSSRGRTQPAVLRPVNPDGLSDDDATDTANNTTNNNALGASSSFSSPAHNNSTSMKDSDEHFGETGDAAQVPPPPFQREASPGPQLPLGPSSSPSAPATTTQSALTAFLQQRRERWAFAGADGDRVGGIVDNLAMNVVDAADTARRAVRLFGLTGAGTF